MSTYDPQSEISRFNSSNATTPYPISRATADVLAEALEIHLLSAGAFDVTVEPLVALWGFGSRGRHDHPPDDDDIKLALRSVGSDMLRVTLDPPAVAKSDPAVRVDLSALAKGYGVDVVSRLLVDRGLTDHMVEIGGEVVARGTKSDSSPWRIGIERPTGTGRIIHRVIRLRDAALATSGDYRNYFQFEGRRYAHAIDPKTGRPVDHNLASVTVLAPTCMQADALATAVLVMGPDRGLELLTHIPNVEAILLIRHPDHHFTQLTTPNIHPYLEPP